MPRPRPMKVIFLGAGSFSASSFKSFLKHSSGLIKSVDVLTNQPGSLLDRLAREEEGTSKVFHCPAKSLNFPFDWKDYSVGIVSSFSLFIPPRIIDQIPLINIHPSMLPQWRGPAPIQYTLLQGQDRTGVSIIDLHPKIIDAGPILLQEALQIPNPNTIFYQELEDQLAEIGGRLAATVTSNLQEYDKSKSIQSLEQISRRVRALAHQIPIKTLDLIEGKQVILEEITLDIAARSNKVAVYPVYDKGIGAVIFKVESKLIGVGKFKIEGKSQIFSAGSFYSNYLKS